MSKRSTDTTSSARERITRPTYGARVRDAERGDGARSRADKRTTRRDRVAASTRQAW